MAQTNLLELAKQGDPQAIATLMNRSLQPRGMTASVDRQGTCLYVTLQAEQVPNRQVLTAFVQNGISNLGVSSIQLVKIAGQQFGMAEPAWTQDLQIEVTDLGDLGLGNLEPSEPTVPPYDAGISLDGLDDIAPAPNPVGDILSELTAPPPDHTFEPEGLSLNPPSLDFEDEFASSDLPALDDDFSGDFSLEAIAPDDTSSGDLSGDLGDDLLADLDLGAGLEPDPMADLQSDDLGLGSFDDLDNALETDLGAGLDDDLGLSGPDGLDGLEDLDGLEGSLPAPDLGSDFSEFDQGTGSFDSAFETSTPADAGMHEPSSDARLSDLNALESTQDWSLDGPDDMLSDLGSLEGDLAQMGDEFLGTDAVTGESRPGMGLEPDEFDLSADLSSDFSSDFSMEPSMEPLSNADEFDLGLPDLEPSSSTSDSSFDLTPEPVDFPLTDFDELSTPSSASEPLSGLEDLDFGDSAPSTPEDAGFGDMGLGSAEFGNTEFGSTEFGSTEFGTEFGNPNFDDASLSDADFDFDTSGSELFSESSVSGDSGDLEGDFAGLEATGEPATNSWQEEDLGAIAAGFETEAQFDDLLPESSFDEGGSSTDFDEPAPTPPPYVAEEMSLDLDLDDIQLPPVTTEGGDDWDADLEFGNLTGEDLSDFTANPAEPAEPTFEAAAEPDALELDSEFANSEFANSEFANSEFATDELTSGDWETALPMAEPSGFDETFGRESAPAPFPADFAESPAAPIFAPAGDSAPWLSELPPEFAIDVTLNGSLLDAAGVGLLEGEGARAIAPESLELAQDLELEAQDLYFESAADSIAPESSPPAAAGDVGFDLENLDNLDSLDNLDTVDSVDDLDPAGGSASLLDTDLFEETFEETSDIPLSQLPTEIPSSEIRDDEPDAPDFLDVPLSGVEFDEIAFDNIYDSAPANEFTLEDETAPTELMPSGEETLPSELLVDDLDESGGFEMDNLGLGLESLGSEEFQPSEAEAAGGDDFGLDGPDEFDLDAPAADWQNEPDLLPETTFGLEDDDEATILLDPSTYPGTSFGTVPQSPELDREELDWLASEVAASANPPVSPLSSAEEGWNYGIPPAPPPPEDTFAYPASAPHPPAPAAVDESEAGEQTEASGGRATNLLYGVLLALLAWILALIGRSLWTELTQPEPPPAPAVEVSPQSQDVNPGRSPFSTFS
ncbi:hypothetical protein HNI00_08375 [Thermoleptolyngbya oregonensis NK1-22]|uniref:Uncharacterized protein n=1 Tax=Thermoleptolyngbya oregonensis NK1-22 TaxID=2547457 RepID=A0AA96Y3J1_9CYAN|nr:hypothetical protein [Thermoleptolyngbya oregonensis]WOB43171.1 hypothetical protein HNI00_08375 [Thermoleptolyngbya oregonensis NK1-22]